MHIMNNKTNKVCGKCKIDKPISEFPKNKGLSDGYHNYCKSCKNKYHKKYGDVFTKAYLKKGGYGIYIIKHKDTEELYIGRGWINERKIDHFTKLKSNKHSNPYMQSLYNINPDFEFKIVEYCDESESFIKERDYILEYYLKDKNKVLNQKIELRNG